MTIAITTALVASLAANAYLIRRGPPRALAPSTPPAPAPVAPAPARAVAPTLAGRPPASALPTTCVAQVQALERQLAETAAALEERLSLPERFERGGRSADAEARIAPFLAEVFAGAPGSLTRDLECHDDVCQLEVTTPEGDRDFDWMQRLQASPGRSQFAGMQFRSGAPTQDPLTHEALFTSVALLRLGEPDRASGMDVLEQLVRALEASDDAARCKAANPTPGHLSLRLALADAAPRVDLQVGGTLASAPVGVCLRGVLDRLVAAAEPGIAPGLIPAVRYVTITVP